MKFSHTELDLQLARNESTWRSSHQKLTRSKVTTTVNEILLAFPPIFTQQITTLEKIFTRALPIEINADAKEKSQSAEEARQDIFPTGTRDSAYLLDQLDI
jgi:hypothetical protein